MHNIISSPPSSSMGFMQTYFFLGGGGQNKIYDHKQKTDAADCLHASTALGENEAERTKKVEYLSVGR